MKKYTLYQMLMAGVLLVSTATGCSNQLDLEGVDNFKGKQVSIVATQGDAITRLTHTDASSGTVGTSGLSVKWKNGDKFMLCQGASLGEEFTTTSDNTSSATFTGTVPVSTGNYYALYPFSRADKYKADWRMSVLGQVQKGSASTAHLSDYNYMVAMSSDLSQPLGFTHMVAVLKFVIDLGGKFPQSLSLSTQDAENMVVSMKLSSDDCWMEDGKAKQQVMQILEEDGKAVTTFSSFTAYMAVFPSTNPLALAVTCTDGTIYNYSVSSNSVSYVAGKLYDVKLTTASGLSDLDVAVFDSNTTASTMPVSGDTYSITTAAHLKDFVTRVNGGEGFASKTVKLLTDIKIDAAATWTPIGTGANPFKGTFDGGGHIISGTIKVGVASYAGFLGYVQNANIANLYVAADLNYSGTNESLGGGYVGAIAGSINSTTVSHCIFAGKFAFTGDASIFVSYVGGIVGNTSSSSKLLYCASTGNLDVTQIMEKGLMIGGIVGRGTQSSGIYNCLNRGLVKGGTSPSIGSSYAGGIVGYMTGINSGNYGKIQCCRNEGIVNTTGSLITGGIIGSGTYTTIHMSHNVQPDITGGTIKVGSIAGASGCTIYRCCTGVTTTTPLLNEFGTGSFNAGTDDHSSL